MTNKPKFNLIAGAAAIDKAIASIQTRGKRLDKDIQIAALSAMQHHAEHGDTMLINRLIAALPVGSRVNALRTYIETFGGVRYCADAKAMVHVKGKVFDIEGAMNVMWNVFKPESAYTSITNPMALIDGLIARFERDVKEMGEGSKVTPQHIMYLKAMQRGLEPATPEFEPDF